MVYVGYCLISSHDFAVSFSSSVGKISSLLWFHFLTNSNLFIRLYCSAEFSVNAPFFKNFFFLTIAVKFVRMSVSIILWKDVDETDILSNPGFDLVTFSNLHLDQEMTLESILTWEGGDGWRWGGGSRVSAGWEHHHEVALCVTCFWCKPKATVSSRKQIYAKQIIRSQKRCSLCGG